MYEIRVPFGPNIDQPHIVDEVKTTDDQFVTKCGKTFDRGRHVRAQEFGSTEDVGEEVCPNCK